MTSLPLRFSKCAWFDEKGYFEFFPLQAVYAQEATFFQSCTVFIWTALGAAEAASAA
jgi:hypothetical protein